MGEEVLVSDVASVHCAEGVGVDELVAKSAVWEIGTLREEEDLGRGGFVDSTATDKVSEVSLARDWGLTSMARESLVCGTTKICHSH